MPFTYQDYLDGKAPPKGWDCADAEADGWTGKEVMAMLRHEAVPLGSDSPAPPPPPPPDTVVKLAPRREARPVQQEKPAEVVAIRKPRQVHQSEDGWRAKLITNDDGEALPRAFNNWVVYTQYHPALAGVFAWNAFSNRVIVQRPGPWHEGPFETHEIGDFEIGALVSFLEWQRLSPTVNNIVPAIKQAAEALTFDPLKDYLKGLRWDGVPRVDTWLCDYLGADDRDYHWIVGKRFLISAVARGLEAGCKVDTMLILEGAQGKLKSSAWQALFGKEFFTDTMPDITSKDALLQIQGVWAVEIAEMHKFTQADSNQVKKFLSTQTDRFRGPYERVARNYGRRTVMCGTINPDGTGYLKDTTGARRFWPVECLDIQIEKIRADRDQLWAEAVMLYNNGNKWWIQPDEADIVTAEQDARTEIDGWTGYIAEAIVGETTVSLKRIVEALGIPKERLDQKHMGRIGRAMRALGYERVAGSADSRASYRLMDRLL